VNIYAAVYDESHRSILDISQQYGKQMIWIVASLVLILAILIIDAKFFSAFSYIIYALSILSLLAVLLVGKEVAGSKSWFQIGSFLLQPSEFAKFATCLALAKYLSDHSTDIKLLRAKIISTILLGLPAVLIFLQNDTGSALVYGAFVLVLYREGLSGSVLIVGVLIIVLFLLTLLLNEFVLIIGLTVIAALFLLITRKARYNRLSVIFALIASIAIVLSVEYAFNNVLEPHQKKRINVLLGKEVDPQGAGYNVHQSKIAIGSGGVLGKGFLQGTQTKYNFVPEQSTDFIFCTVGEEWGFAGSVVVIGLFILLMTRLIKLAERQRSAFSRIYGYGVVSLLFLHFLVNIGMTIGLIPVIGIPLPFLSYGGSSLWSFTILLFIFLKQDAHRFDTLF
jgi:rod shape determining protein RodA